MKRRLIYHPESDCLFEVFTEEEWERSLENQCDDVTGLEHHEQQFLKEYLEKIRAETIGSQNRVP